MHATEGRLARSARLIGESWRYLRKRPRLLAFPLVSAVACIGAFRRRWAEAVVADVGIGAVFGLLMAPGFLSVVVGLGAGSTVAVLAGLVWIAPLIALSSALTELFTLQLYCEDAAGPFGERSLRTAVRRKPRRRLLSRGRAA